MKYNYIKHLNTWFVVFKQCTHARPVHASIYLALFQMWNINRFSSSFVLSRSNLMQVAKIKSNKTYSEALKDLVLWGWITYTAGSTFYGLSNFSLHSWQQLKKLIVEDGDMMFATGVEDAAVDTTVGEPNATSTNTSTATPTGTPAGTPFYKRNTKSTKETKFKYNKDDYGNYSEGL